VYNNLVSGFSACLSGIRALEVGCVSDNLEKSASLTSALLLSPFWSAALSCIISASLNPMNSISARNLRPLGVLAAAFAIFLKRIKLAVMLVSFMN